MNHELIPTSPIAPARRQKTPGSGRRPGSLNVVSALMKQQLAEAIEDGGPGQNPLCVLYRIANDEGASPMTRVQAADRLLRYLAPRLIAIDRSEQDTAPNAKITIQCLQALLSPGNEPTTPKLIDTRNEETQ